MKVIHLLTALMLAALGVIAQPSSAPAQQVPYQWSTPELIPDYFDLLRAPLLVADARGTVHAFDMEDRDDREFFIMYRTWEPDQGWSPPVDILLAPFLEIAPRLLSIYLDPTGELHLIFGAGGDVGQIYYSHVPVENAANARAWSPPLELRTDTGRDSPADITGDGAGHLVIVYGGTRLGEGLYQVRSMDGGASWTEPILLSRSQRPDLFSWSIWSEADEAGRVHTTWSVVNALGRGREIRYGRLEAGLQTWSDEALLAEAVGTDDLGWPSLITRGDEVFVAYQDGFPATRWVRRSTDGGETWSPPVRPFPHRGDYQLTSLVKDGLNNIHMVLGNRLQDPEIYGMWYSRLVDQRWLPLAPIVAGPQTDAFQPCCPQAVVSRGNLLLATWSNFASREHRTGAWYSYVYLPVPETPLVEASPPQTPAVASGASEEVTATPSTPEASAGPVGAPPNSVAATSPRATNPGVSIYIGLAPVVVLMVLLMRRRRRPVSDPLKARGRDSGERREANQ